MLIKYLNEPDSPEKLKSEEAKKTRLIDRRFKSRLDTIVES